MSEDKKTTAPASGDGGTPGPSARPPCPQTCCCGNLRWIDTQAYCGDNARLEGSFTGTCPDGPATVEILHPTNGSVVDTIRTNIAGGRVTATWITKAQTAAWRTDRHRFRIQAAGVTCTSSNEFTFRQRPTVAWATLDVAHVKTTAALGSVFEYHDASLDADRVHYRLKLRTHGSPFDAAKQTNAVTRIQDAWNNGFNNKKFHRTRCQRGATCDCAFDCCKAGYRLDVQFVASGEHALLQIVATAAGAPRQGSFLAASGGRPITGTWGDPPRNDDSTYAHEMGHMLGQFDEYVTTPPGGNDPTGVQPITPPAGGENLMSTSGNTVLLKRHYRWALKYLNDHAAGDPYEIIPP